MSAETFPYDVLLSHSAKDKAAVRPLAERLRADGLKVWFDEWVLKPGDSIPAKIEDGPLILDLRSPSCRPMRAAQTGRSHWCALNHQLSILNQLAPR
jgi:hypothetical protein